MIDFSKLFLIVFCYYLLTFIDTSMVYHMIRAQTIIKLYIFFNMLEVGTFFCFNNGDFQKKNRPLIFNQNQVADRLLCSIGQDILEALNWTIIQPNKSKILILPHLFISSIYVCMCVRHQLKRNLLRIFLNSYLYSIF